MQTSPSSQAPKVERDPRLFLWFMTLVIGAMYAVSLAEKPSMREAGTLVPLAILLVVNVVLHWQLEKITAQPSRIFWYILLQGALAFAISVLAKSFGLTFAVFMALIGEAVGLLRLTRQGVLAIVYYLALLVTCLIQFLGWDSSGLLILATVPMVIFVVMYVTLYMRQNEAREQAQRLAAELEAANRQLSEYAAQVEDLTIANERQRMARELHDTLSQGLAGLILQLEAVDAHLANDRREKAQIIITSAMVQARATLSEARRAIDDLRQSSADDLDSALRLEVSRFTGTTDIPVRFQANSIPPLPDAVKETVIRTVAEALTNIANHAHAHNVEVMVRTEAENLSVTIQDDGQGFDPSSIPSGHYGLLGIQERAHLVNGCIGIKSESGKGTTLTLQVPLSPESSSENNRNQGEKE